MKLNPTSYGSYKLDQISWRIKARTEVEKPAFDSPIALFKAARSALSDLSKPSVTKANAGSPFRAKSWQNKLWRKYFKPNPISQTPKFYTTSDGRKIESVVLKYFVIRCVYDEKTEEIKFREKIVNECCYCKDFYSITKQLCEVLHEIDRVNLTIREDELVSTYNATFRALVRYADGTYDSTPSYLNDVFDILGLKPSFNSGKYRIALNPSTTWTPMQNVIRGEYK